MSDDLLSIGGFALLSGLSIPALRHYDEVGVLKPARIDPNGYRRYRSEQVRDAKLIRALRAVELPIDRIREVLAGPDDEFVRGVLSEHRAHIDGRLHALSTMVATLDEYIETGVPMAARTTSRIVEINIGVTDLAESRRFYEAAFAVEFAEDQHDGGPVHLAASFGTWPSDQFFLLNINEARWDPDRGGRSSFGFLVDDLDAVHKRAIEAGAFEVAPPGEVSGMPRTSAIDDPSGNRINLYQDVQ